jgi:single-stranded-DNA-specific exonuclease
LEHYLNTTNEDINSPKAFGEEKMKAGATEIAKAIKENKNVLIIVDADCDGFTSSAILINYLHDLFPAWVENHVKWFIHEGKQHGLNDCIDYALGGGFSLVCCPDSSSNDYEEHRLLKENNISCLVLDHHEADKIDENAIIINNQLSDYPNKHLSGAGVTWQFCRYLDELFNSNYANNYLDLVALGNDADMMSLRSFETKHLIQKGFK